MKTRNPTCGGCKPCLIPVDCPHCCRCIPRRICVEAEGEDYGCCPNTKSMLEWDDYANEYAGGVCGIDLRFYYAPNEDGECALFLESECAGLVGDYAPSRVVDCHDMENLSVSYSVDTYGCSDCGDVTLKVTAESLLNVDFCADCFCVPECLCVKVIVFEFEGAAEPSCLGSDVFCTEGASYDEVVWEGTVETESSEFHDRDRVSAYRTHRGQNRPARQPDQLQLRRGRKPDRRAKSAGADRH